MLLFVLHIPGHQNFDSKKVVEAISLYLTKRTIEKHAPALSSEFDNHFLGTIDDDNLEVLTHYTDYLRIDGLGLLTSAFVREVDNLATSVRFSAQRKNIEVEVNKIAAHLLEFDKLKLSGFRLETSRWYNELTTTSYGFLLVAKPEEAREAGIKPYMERASQRLAIGIKRLYVLGRRAELDFYNSVLAELMDTKEYRLSETFRLFKDYRGNPNGLGALFTVDPVREQLGKSKPIIPNTGDEEDVLSSVVIEEQPSQTLYYLSKDGITYGPHILGKLNLFSIVALSRIMIICGRREWRNGKLLEI